MLRRVLRPLCLLSDVLSRQAFCVHFGPRVAFFITASDLHDILAYSFPLLNFLTVLTDMGERGMP